MTAPQKDYLPELLQAMQNLTRQDAINLLDQAARQYPADPRPVLLIAAELMHANQVDQAEGAYLVALQRAPDFAIARFQLGLLQLTSGRPAAAMATWSPLDQLDEKDPLRLFKRGLEAMAQDQFSEARRLLLEGMAQNTVNQPLNVDMQKVLDRIAGLGLTDAAQPEGSEAAGQSPEKPAEGNHFLISSYRQ
jgi:tetratricopeptide (TPR) repeat protein